MFCAQHPKYKGIMEPQGKKKDCETCWEIYRTVAAKSKYYRSITTPEFPCGLAHILTEVSTLMLFGSQPPYFWRKDSDARECVKEYFSKTYVMLQKAYKKNSADFAQIKKWFGVIYWSKKKEMVFEDLQYKDFIAPESKSEPKPTNQQVDELLGKIQERNSRWKQWRNINGEEKK